MAFDTKTSNSKAEEDNQRRIDREIKDMVSTLTQRLTDLQSKSKQLLGDSSHIDGDDEHGIRVVTLAGNNTGATMRADLGELLDGHGVDPHELLGAYTNSNYQAVNNSIMMDGSYSAEDPGVHVFISDYVEEHDQGMEELAKMKERKKKKGHSKSTKENSSDKDYEKKSDVEALN
ncbi:uncharacterized protein LOC131248720 [Magnolia sinica]|uniref:uncharacterized protein LOC131248720 n=1 Tax=Magnolia sinica TaxID=86752 RepID=UPI00265965F3|nr:uncharacterized protein LOC131248720 [Magnolia sinica]